jgi:hypothetical protein
MPTESMRTHCSQRLRVESSKPFVYSSKANRTRLYVLCMLRQPSDFPTARFACGRRSL